MQVRGTHTDELTWVAQHKRSSDGADDDVFGLSGPAPRPTFLTVTLRNFALVLPNIDLISDIITRKMFTRNPELVL